MTAWAIVGDAHGLEYVRLARVVMLTNGSYVCRPWIWPWKKIVTSRVVFRVVREKPEWSERPRKTYNTWADLLRKDMRKRSFVFETYFLGRGAGQGRLESLVTAIAWRIDSLRWRRLIRMMKNRGPRTEKRLYKALRRAPKIFSRRIR